MAKCTKCGKEIVWTAGYYNCLSGILCVKCGESKVPTDLEMMRYIQKVAKIPLGSAPSVG